MLRGTLWVRSSNELVKSPEIQAYHVGMRVCTIDVVYMVADECFGPLFQKIM